MHIIKDKKAIGLPTVLLLAAFVIALISTLLTYTVFQSRLINKSIDTTESYLNAKQAITATLRIIDRDQITDSQELNDLQEFMNVHIISPTGNNSVYTVTAMVTETTFLTSYFSRGTNSTSTFSEVFSKTKLAGPDLHASITPTSLLAARLPDFITTAFPHLVPQTGFRDFPHIIDYLESLVDQPNSFRRISAWDLSNQGPQITVNRHLFVDGPLNLPNGYNLTVAPNYVLVVNGDLEMNSHSTLTGTVIVNGNVIIDGRPNTRQTIIGTLYISGRFQTNAPTNFGTARRPTFIFAELDILINHSLTGYGYLLSNRNIIDRETPISITGGIYAAGELRTSATPTQSTTLTASMLSDFFVPMTVFIEGGQDSTFKYTLPTKLKP